MFGNGLVAAVLFECIVVALALALALEIAVGPAVAVAVAVIARRRNTPDLTSLDHYCCYCTF